MADVNTGGFAAVGNDAPYGLPDSSFRALSQANATGSFSIPAFNLSSPNPSVQGDGRSWNIEISLQANVPLGNSNDSSLDAAQEKEFTQFVSIGANNVDKTEIAKIASSNTLCAYIVFGLNSNATADNQNDASKGGKCDFFSQQCQNDFQSVVQGNGPKCGAVTIPDSCSDWFGSSGPLDFQMVSFALNEKLLTDSRFFTYGTPPTSENNVTEYDAAVATIWPVLFTWTHASNKSDITSQTGSTLRCLRTSNITSGSRVPVNTTTKGGKGNGAAGTHSVPTLVVTLLLAGLASGLVFL
ncbi:hypothetical protein ACHAQJ_003713 [Trichoderma viride]